MDALASPSAAEVDSAVAEAIFSMHNAGRPVYSTPDEDAFVAFAAFLGTQVSEARELLLRTAAAQVSGDFAWNRPFARVTRDLHESSTGSLNAPPGLATIAVLSLAADSMHAAGGMAAHNYYGRLHGLLDTPEGKKKAVESGYREHGEDLWDALNAWLEAWEGERGIPTAYVVGTMRYVGLALSQALIRRADRDKLPRVFLDEGLPPGYRMAPSDMEATLDEWMPRHPPLFSQSLRALWSNPMARERIAGVACLELESWDGSGFSGVGLDSNGPASQVRLIAHLTSFPRNAVSFDLSVPVRGARGRVPLTIDTAEGAASVLFRPHTAGTLCLDDPDAIDVESLLSDELRITGEAPGLHWRRPRRVVPLRFDELQRAFVEVETAHLGETTLVLAADVTRSKVSELLGAVARRGWSQLPPGTRGMPSGWSAYRDVQILARAEGPVPLDLYPLLPRASVSLVLSGGLALPGLLRKWSSLAPPSVHAVSPAADSLTVEVSRGTRAGECLVSESVAASVAIVELADHDLADGDYLVAVKVSGAASPSATALLRLRSGNSPRLRRPELRLSYQPGSGGLWPIAAIVGGNVEHVDGARVEIPRGTRPGSLGPMTAAAPRSSGRTPGPQRLALKVGLALGHDSCMRTGMHRMVIPPALGGVPATRSVDGRCATCGLIKRYPTNPAAAVAMKTRSTARKPPAPLDLGQIPEIRALDAAT